MTQIEQIKAEIERIDIECQGKQYYIPARQKLGELRTFIDSLEKKEAQEEIPRHKQTLGCLRLLLSCSGDKDTNNKPKIQGLDEAAETFAHNGDVNGVGGEEYEDDLRITFKAGAEWMAGQGVSMQVTDDTEWSEVDLVVHKNVCEGSIIQIRKKQ